MRRKIKFNIHTNKTLKNCPNCLEFCVICKGKCKANVIGYENNKSIPENHPKCKTMKLLHKYGTGKLDRGRGFVFKIPARHCHYSFLPISPETRLRKKQRFQESIKKQLLFMGGAKSNKLLIDFD